MPSTLVVVIVVFWMNKKGENNCISLGKSKEMLVGRDSWLLVSLFIHIYAWKDFVGSCVGDDGGVAVCCSLRKISPCTSQ